MSEPKDPNETIAHSIRETLAQYIQTINEEGTDPTEQDKKAREILGSVFKYLPENVVILFPMNDESAVIRRGKTQEEILQGDIWNLFEVLDYVHQIEDSF